MQRADAVCRAYGDGAKAVARPRTYDEIVAWAKRTLPLYEDALRRLEALEPPAKDRGAVRAWLAADRRVARAVRDVADAAGRRDFPGVNAAASRAQLAGSESRRAASGLGLHVCARLVSGR